MLALITIYKISFILLIAYVLFRRSLVFLQIAQQDEYSPKSLLCWYKENKAFDRRISSLLLLSFFLYLFNWHLLSVLPILGILFLILLSVNPLKQAKLKLNLTDRARQVLYLHLGLIVVALLFLIFRFSYQSNLIFFIILLQLVPFILMLALKAHAPFELRKQAAFLEDAKKKYQSVNPFTIGITGSFGKTSIKNYLAETLGSTHGSVFYPTAGTNTLMGNTKAIRELLNPNHQYAVIEMAAYRRGSIAALCKLTQPKAAIISAVGTQHLERFGSLDVTYQAKSELAQAVPYDGILVCNADNQLAAKMAVEFPKKTTLLYGFTDEAKDVRAKNYLVTPQGSEFFVTYQGKDYQVKTPLFGRTACSNLLAVFALSVALKIQPELIVASFQNLQVVPNRLELRKQKEVYYLNDAYNANEIGMADGLDIVRQLPSHFKVLMTPGVIELGEQQQEINSEVAKLASEVCDRVIIVGKPNRQAYQQSVAADKLIVVDNREEAFRKLNELLSEQNYQDSIVYIANDLTDYHENKYVF